MIITIGLPIFLFLFLLYSLKVEAELEGLSASEDVYAGINCCRNSSFMIVITVLNQGYKIISRIKWVHVIKYSVIRLMLQNNV